jgi:TPR repeat protein
MYPPTMGLPAPPALAQEPPAIMSSFVDDDKAIELLEQAVLNDSNEARYQLAVRLTQGKGIEKDPERVVELYSQAAGDGHVPSMYGLGACFQNGYGIEQNEEEAICWLTAAANQNYADAWHGLGIIRSKNGDHQAAAECWQRAAELGQSAAMYSLACAYESGDGVPQDEDKMRELTARAASLGHVEAQYWMGNYHRFGENGFEQDHEKAFEWYKQAAYHDHPRAVYSMGLHLILGYGVDQDINQGWDLVEKAAKLDCVDAMMCMGKMIDSGQAPVDDPEVALHWYQQAADKGNADAQWITGQRLLEIPNEKRFARDYLMSAAEQGHDEARQLLEALDETDEAAGQKQPMPQDYASAAIAGDPQAQFQLGFAHYMGLGVEQSFAKSYFWMALVAKTLPDQATQMLAMLSSQLTGEQKARLDATAAEWVPGSLPNIP